YAQARRTYFGYQSRSLRSKDLQGSVRDRAAQARPKEGGRKENRGGGARREAEQRDQPDGRLAPEHQARQRAQAAPQGRARGRPSSQGRLKHDAAAQHAKGAADVAAPCFRTPVSEIVIRTLQ